MFLRAMHFGIWTILTCGLIVNGGRLVAGQAPGLLPEPHAVVQKDAEKRIKEAFKAEYAARKPAEKRALARKLIETAREIRRGRTRASPSGP